MTKRPQREERPTNLSVSRLIAQSEKAAAFVDSFRLWDGGVMFKATIVLSKTGLDEGLRPITVGFPSDEEAQFVDIEATVDGKKDFSLSHFNRSGHELIWVQSGYNDGQILWETDMWISRQPKSLLGVRMTWPLGQLYGSEEIDIASHRRIAEAGGQL